MADVITQRIDVVDEIQTITFMSGKETFVFTLDAASLATQENIIKLIAVIDNAIATSNLNGNYIASFLENQGFTKELAASIENMYRIHQENLADSLEYSNGDSVTVTSAMVNAIYGLGEEMDEDVITEG